MGDARIAEAENGLRRLFPNRELEGARFLDIGSGSGLSSLAAAKLGAAQITAVDIDRDSVEATSTLLGQMLPAGTWSANLRSVFDLTPETDGTFDVVYSWGVLHHTSDMWRAVRIAATLVRPGGLLAIALYSKTPLCGLWRIEKRIYSKSPKFVQAAIRVPYKAAWCLHILRQGKNPARRIREYCSNRGMSWSHDVHDWLGGYPYQSARPEEVRSALTAQEFSIEREFLIPGRRLNGLFGTGCDEYVARRIH